MCVPESILTYVAHFECVKHWYTSGIAINVLEARAVLEKM
jgi:hypothetical protein